MHTTRVGKLAVQHNSDWSGEVTLVLPVTRYAEFGLSSVQDSVSVAVDGAEFLKLCAAIVTRAKK
jgi:hypothetical protein